MKVLGEGAVIRREDKPKSKCRKWTLRFKTDCGSKEKRFTGTYSEAKAALGEFKTKLQLNVSDVKFKDYVRTWYTRRERSGECALSTLAKDRNTLRVLCRLYGNMKLADITHGIAVDRLLEAKVENNYSSWYYNGLFVRLKSILSSAVKDDLISKNVLEDDKPPKTEKTSRRALSPDEFHSFLLRLSVERLRPHIVAIYIALLTGSRRGEICGFTWNDVDFNNRVMYVRRSVMENGGIKGPKTTSGFRVYPIMDKLLDLLKRWQSVQEVELKAIGIKQTLATPIVNSDVGTVMNPNALGKWWRLHRDDLGMPGVVIHELRHTYLTMLANSGAPMKVIQDIAGWASIAQADRYVHSDMTAQRRAVDSLEGILSESQIWDS